ncbi:putative DNA-binding transcriptional regulator AlpA [Zhongshania antarctica]|uniref:Putative DNA-binding transcriptional regulator AlpA n=1 Tax=Zhongshania antarctica TaxID=641702 RepID=A0A840R861_9GAMM|nr:AlpA family phage regulatory protein [Zhongshania antarctica]MBB5188550.1 putative DNA-binding transcriptional regulator AlpA [Zhongshania antarctica]
MQKVNATPATSKIQTPDHRYTTLPETGFLRLKSIIGDRNAKPPIPALIPVSSATWWKGVKELRYPQPVKLAPNVTAWRVEDIRELIQRQGG